MIDEAERPLRELILAYAPANGRAGLSALLALDDTLARLMRTTHEPALGQLRLAWWRDSLPRLDTAPAPAEPVLQGLEAHILSRGVSGASLVPIVHGWEVLVEEERLHSDALKRFAEGRGVLFVAAGAAIGAQTDDPLDLAGRGWALADLANNLSNPEEAAEVRAEARPILADALKRRWSPGARALGAMAHISLMDMDEGRRPIRRLGRLLWHRLSGR
ncbi:hypothetical protein [Sphingomonas xinjiangensis]|uniref:Phytoene synthase n=1 Tax=Sphingomonas xinjiangensis TaxID=643568 RepID=A0A840YNK9_9SPHN|nr:hypothetical protein [Sphingomonas xinjiangensis]MBB5709102.1 phytoene synthase [Sphingomonas xinjiangensis]